MPQISKNLLSKERLGRVFNLFFDLVSNTNNKNTAQQVVGEILTDTERVMIAKRIACYYLITQDVSSGEIAETLNLSRATINHHKYVFKNAPKVRSFLERRLKTNGVKKILKEIFVELFYGQLRPGTDWSDQKRTYYAEKRRLKQKI
ncbi:hypothetical protein HYT33_04345 [Candidatus Roizmanbacteria bacterium]|nr:hypothetical protein [Candidatus Roizmanbacteria bacterium]